METRLVDAPFHEWEIGGVQAFVYFSHLSLPSVLRSPSSPPIPPVLSQGGGKSRS